MQGRAMVIFALAIGLALFAVDLLDVANRKHVR
jgi:hypothetical protein